MGGTMYAWVGWVQTPQIFLATLWTSQVGAAIVPNVLNINVEKEACISDENVILLIMFYIF